MNLIPDNPTHCPTCATKFEGPFCYACGEKQTSHKDYTLKKYAAQAVDMFTHVDGKIFNSFKYLLFFPGKLTEENLLGRKVKLMKPMQLFIVINLVYFLLLKQADIFLVYLRLLYDKNVSGIRNAVHYYADKQDISVADYIAHFDSILPTTAKALVALLIPALSIMIWLLYAKRSKAFVPHLIHATHIFSFFLVFTFAFMWLVIFPLDGTEFFETYRFWIWASNLPIFFLYIYVSSKRVYKQAVWLTLTKTFVVLCWLVLIQNLYRNGIVWLNFLFA